MQARLVEEDAIDVTGVALVPLVNGALWWPDERLLVVADLHLEKGSSFARRRMLLPPYDTVATLNALAATIARLGPRAVVALGDSFHDRWGHDRLGDEARALITACQQGRDWIWIAGNHDPAPPAGVGGRAVDELVVGAIAFRHEPMHGAAGEIAGHLHPVAKLRGRGRALRRRCFATDGTRLIMPAFGAFTGGLNLLDEAFAGLFGASLCAWLAGDDGLYRVAPGQLVPD